MLSYRKIVLLVGVAALTAGLMVYVGQDAQVPMPPPLPTAVTVHVQLRRGEFPSLDALSRPWFVDSLPARVESKKVPTSPTNNWTLIFLGLYKSQDHQTNYFFKNQSNGSFLILQIGRTTNGWTLTTVKEHQFIISGPGGMYAVSR